MSTSRKCAGAAIIGFILVGTAATVTAIVLTESDSNDKRSTAYPDLATPIGKIKGKVGEFSLTGKKYVSYKGIPFAMPPVGDLRFARPVPAPVASPGQVINPTQGSKSCLTATKYPPSKYYGEDCLYMNIYTPYDTSRTRAKYSVMVWLHPGGFVAGSVYPEPLKLVTQGEVIVVMVNYRLGVFGFLTTLTDELPSNNGLWDQYLAIKWVSDNIQYLNGNDTSITVFGNSAGAMSTGLHVLSPVSSPYFQKAIMQSGVASSLISRTPYQYAMNFSQMVGCGDINDSANLVTCLRNVSVNDILLNTKPSSFDIPLAQQQVDFIWTPVVDGEFIVDEPLQLLSNQTFLSEVSANSKDYMMGIVNDEGGIVPHNFLNPVPITTLSNVSFYKDLVDSLVSMRYGRVSRKMVEAVNEFYTGYKIPKSNTFIDYHRVLDMVSDFLFFIPSTEMALALSKCSNDTSGTCQAATESGGCRDTSEPMSRTFYYHFDLCPPKDPCDAPCLVHGEEFTFEFLKTVESDHQRRLSDLFIDLLTTFAKTSDPGQAVSCGWPDFEPTSRSYLNLNADPSIRRFLYNSRQTFWFERISNNS